jgi:hypothetical protein
MKGLLAVAWREIVERRMVLFAAAVLGLLVFLVPLFPGAARYGADQARLFTAAFTALLFCASLALLLGGSTIGRDLTERRLGFYLARPISEAAIWGGKFLGIWVLVAASAVALLLPVGLVDFASWWPAAGGWRAVQVALLFAAAVLFALALGNVVGASLRERSAWTLADLAMLALVALGLAAILFPLIQADAPALTARVAAGLAVGVSLSLLLAGFAQVAIGRVDQRRGTRARFAALWGLLVLVAAGCLGSVRWLLSPDPRDLTSATVDHAASQGNWIVLGGRASHRVDLTASFFYEVSSGRFVRALVEHRGTAVLSGDGSAAAWSLPSLLGEQERQEVWFCRLTGSAMRPRRTSIVEKIWDLQLSPEGSRLAVWGADELSVFDVESGRVLASVARQTAGLNLFRSVFLDRDHLLLYRSGPVGAPGVEGRTPGSIAIEELEISSRRSSAAILIEGLSRPFSLGFDDRRRRLIVWQKEGEVSLVDSSSGTRLAVLAGSGWAPGSRAFLADGRPVLAETTGGIGRVHLFAADGRPERDFEVGPARAVWIGGEPEPGKLALAILQTPPEVFAAADSFVLDLGTGALRKIANHAAPVAAQLRWRLPYLEPGSAATRLLWRHDGAILRFDPKTGSVETLRLQS